MTLDVRDRKVERTRRLATGGRQHVLNPSHPCGGKDPVVMHMGLAPGSLAPGTVSVIRAGTELALAKVGAFRIDHWYFRSIFGRIAVEAPKERKRLELKPRSAVEPSAAEQSPRSEGEPAQPKKKVDPFGGARPVDVTSIEKKVEEKLQQKQAEEKQRLEELRAKKAAEAEEAKAGDRFVRRGDGKEAASSKSDAVDSWRAGPKAEGDAKRPAAGSAWGKDRKRSESSSATPKSPTDNKSVDELVPKVNAFNLLTDEVSWDVRVCARLINIAICRTGRIGRSGISLKGGIAFIVALA